MFIWRLLQLLVDLVEPFDLFLPWTKRFIEASVKYAISI
ncbi:hypothetical protein LT85_0520 [Collimonas arenae]|uniref:Uncharacterized protein n=1 Tax=Collimonas arenae TaxID=279058 RepID=A0A0A1F7B0_9BURK|nr:hypothetical protein LT85_0520 [Collimonas arenae]